MTTYSIDVDELGIRQRVVDAITGALAYGVQGTNPAPSGHWLEPFWRIARDTINATPPRSVVSAETAVSWAERNNADLLEAIREYGEMCAHGNADDQEDALADLYALLPSRSAGNGGEQTRPSSTGGVSSIDKRSVGLYAKFHVERTDGSSAPGAKHDGCDYFVLDVTHDPHAMPALRAYADSCAAEYPALAADLRAKLPPVAMANDGNSEAQYVDDGRNLNCPACGGSGHVDDAAHAMTNPTDTIEQRARKLLAAEYERAELPGAAEGIRSGNFSLQRTEHAALRAIAAALRSVETADEPVAFCDPTDPLSWTAFSWPGTGRADKHTSPLYLRPQPATPTSGNWINADDVNALVRRLDVAINGEAGAAKQASLCDIVLQVEQMQRAAGEPVAYQATPYGVENWSPIGKKDYDEAIANDGWVKIAAAGGEMRWSVRALYTRPQTGDARLAETQRAIIEAAERRGYERGLKERPALAVTDQEMDKAHRTLVDLFFCARNWHEDARILGNVRAGDAASALATVIAERRTILVTDEDVAAAIRAQTMCAIAESADAKMLMRAALESFAKRKAGA